MKSFVKIAKGFEACQASEYASLCFCFTGEIFAQKKSTIDFLRTTNYPERFTKTYPSLNSIKIVRVGNNSIVNNSKFF